MAIRFLSTQYIDGSLGIGTANPQDQLHLASSLPSIRLEDTDDNYYHRIRGNGSNLIIVADAGNAANNSSIRFQVDADEKMRITSDGNVGINITPASSVALDVKEPDSSNDLILGLTAGTGSRAQIRSVVQTSTESALSFHTTLSSSTQERFRILNTGAFSLGNSGTNYGTAGQVLTSNGNSAPYWSTPTSGTITGSGTSGRLAKFTGTSSIGDSGIIDSSNAVAITINGNEEVGIGTSPFTKLDVYDSSTSVNIIRARNNTQQIALGVNDASGGAFLFVNTNHALRFGCNGSEVARFTADGTLKFPSAAKTKKIELWSTTTNDYQFYGFGVEGSTLVYSVYDVGDSHVFFAGSSSTSRNELMRVSGNDGVFIQDDFHITSTSSYQGFGWNRNVNNGTILNSSMNAFQMFNDTNLKLQGYNSSGINQFEHIFYNDGNIFFDGKVGIGVTSPTAKLDVQSSGSWGQYGRGSSGDINVENTNTSVTEGGWIGIAGYMGNTANGGYYHMAGITAKKSTTAGDGNYGGDLSFWTTAGSGQSGEANSGMYQRMTINRFGRVGIGTTAPSETLQVNGNIRIAGVGNTLGFDTTGALLSNGIKTINDYETVIYNGRGAAGFAVIGNSSIRLGFGSNYTNAQTDLFINSSGSVGIGTTSPAAQLVVFGNIGFGAGGYNGGVYANNTSGDVDSNWGLEVQRTSGVDDYNTRLKYYPVNGTSRKAGIWSSRDNYFTIYSNDDTVPDIIIPNGLLGVGSTNPGRGITIDKSGGNAALEIIKNNTGNQIVYLGTGSSAGTDDSILQLKHNSTEQIRLYTTGDSWINGGNVGIGTTSPSSKLHVSGTGTVARLQSNSTYVDMLLVSSGNTGFLNLGATGMNFYVNGGSASNLHMHISNAGNVGIGTTSPSSVLHIDQPSNDRAGGLYIERNGSSYGLAAFVNSGGYGIIGGGGSYANDVISIDFNNAYVGIGVSAPNAKLEVNGDISIRGGNGLYFGQSTGSLNSWTTRLFSSGSTQYFNGQTFIFNNVGYGSTEFVRFTSGGRVGVGVTNPSARLQVNYDGNNGGGDLTGYGILHQSSASGQATIGAHNTGDGYANLNLSSTVSGAQKLWHISKRPNSNSNRLEYFFYDTTFYSRFIFTYLGDFHADGDIVAYSTTASDEKLKDNIEPIHNALDKVSKLNGVSFTWNCGSRKDEKDLGVIAQNVEKVLPELVREKESPYHDDQTIKTVDYEKLTAVLIEAVKELQQKVEKLEKKKCCCK